MSDTADSLEDEILDGFESRMAESDVSPEVAAIFADAHEGETFGDDDALADAVEEAVTDEGGRE